MRPADAPDPAPETTPVAYWDSELQNVVLDEDWLRAELAQLQAEAKVRLTREEFEAESEQLRLAVIADPRLRACIRKENGKPSSPSQFRRFASYTSGWFRRALLRKVRGKGRRSETESFRELDRQWGNRVEEAAAKIAACRRDHEREAVRGDPHKEGFVVEWCPDGCGWQRRVELEAKG